MPGGLAGVELYAVPVLGSPIRGPAVAWVTLIEIADFQCDHCARVQPIVAELRRTYDRDLRIVYKHFPLSNHAHAMTAARASECARDQGRFWRLHDYIYSHQDQLGTVAIGDLVKRAGGISLSKWRACMEAGGVDDRIADDKEEALALGIVGAPTFLINGRLLTGVQPLAEFERVIDEELERAKGSGVAKAQYYRKMIMNGGR